MQSNAPQRGQAVVIGSGLAGLLAARVASDHFDRVLVVDRDELPQQPRPRAGVGQGHHAHGLVARGYEIFAQLFPGLPEELEEDGVKPGDFSADIDWYVGGTLLAAEPTGLVSLPATRPTLEHHVRRRVAAIPHVSIRGQAEVASLRVSGRHVTGVRLYDRRTQGEEELDADLVIDCSGRGARLARWMKDCQLVPPEEERVEIGLAYTSARFAVSQDPFGDKIATILANTPDAPRGCLVYRSPRDPGVVEVSLTGMVGDHAPTDLDGFLEFARSLPVPQVHRVLEGAELVDGPVRLTYPASRWRHYESCPELLEGVVPLGDAICSLNPIYAQGMTVAALQVLELDRQLARERFVTRDYLKGCAKAIAPAWSLTTGADLGYPAAVGRRTRAIRVVNAYVARLQRAAARDPKLSTAFFEVAGLTRAPASLFRPSVVARVLWNGRATPTSHSRIEVTHG